MAKSSKKKPQTSRSAEGKSGKNPKRVAAGKRRFKKLVAELGSVEAAREYLFGKNGKAAKKAAAKKKAKAKTSRSAGGKGGAKAKTSKAKAKAKSAKAAAKKAKAKAKSSRKPKTAAEKIKAKRAATRARMAKVRQRRLLTNEQYVLQQIQRREGTLGLEPTAAEKRLARIIASRNTAKPITPVSPEEQRKAAFLKKIAKETRDEAARRVAEMRRIRLAEEARQKKLAEEKEVHAQVAEELKKYQGEIEKKGGLPGLAEELKTV